MATNHSGAAKQPPNPDRPRIITARAFVQTLAAAGILHEEDLNRIAEVCIIVNPNDAVIIQVHYLADERLAGLVSGWGDVRQAYEDQLRGRKARILEEQLAKEEAEELHEQTLQNTIRRAEETGLESERA